MTTNNPPAHGPVSLDRLRQISEILRKAAAQSDGGNLGYAMADAVKVIDGAIASFGAEPVAWLHSDNGIGIPAITRSRNVADSWFSKGWNIKPLYTTPPAPVVQPVMFIDGDISASDAEKLAAVIREWDDAPAPERDRVRREHAEWSQATFGDVGPVGPLKHLSKEALEAAAEP
ncbi:dATP/dGTP pyrophosphohydrolase domain-containing protein, partial [Citrobacter freundii]